MLEPRETDLPALFLVFVVLPLVTYILLGKWNESSKKKERITVLSEQAAEEARKVEEMAAAIVIPLLPLPNNLIHQCARCYGPANTRCSQCKSVWYCSGKCQIIHWREVHKHKCQQLNNIRSNSSPRPASVQEFHETVSFDGKIDSEICEYNVKQPMLERTPSGNINPPPLGSPACITVDTSGVGCIEKRSSRKGSRDMLNKGDGPVSECCGQASVNGGTCSPLPCNIPAKQASMRQKLRESDSLLSDQDVHILGGVNGAHANSRSKQQETYVLQRRSKHSSDMKNNFATTNSSNVSNNGMGICNTSMESTGGENFWRKEITSRDELADMYTSTERALMKKSNKTKIASHSQGSKHHKSPKSMVKSSREQSCSDLDHKGATANESKSIRAKDCESSQGRDVTSTGIMKMIGLIKPSKHDRQESEGVNSDRYKKVKMLFPYEEFVRFFQCEVFNMSPRGLINCGNSCYANAVLQCLSCTKPLTVFLLRRSHSRACCGKDWCLMCELEQHVMMLREGGGPLSPSQILSHIRRTNCQIGDGSQEDAHEFLRLLVASMQSICLESLGGENVVDPRLQETTFIQHIFGGRLRSKVKCLRCHHESARSENIMDLTLEIFGWVESLEDALTQFTSPEDLDGENMYRCSRCATYVRARKQLSIQEAPNILTIVLKRFQEGSYGKINKCISFPDMLDMVPFMTGTDDVPPLYMLYAVVVHLDTLNASFSGHYISYVKDLQGNWFRIDDTEVQPVEISQVMSEGAYILFYMRSSPRPTRASLRKTTCLQAAGIPKHCPSRAQKSSGGIHRIPNGNRQSIREKYARSMSMEFSDATSSDWSLFTSSDDASFTTESTRDSFSTVDYADASNIDPISSIFNSLYASEYPPHKAIACSMFSASKPQTRFFSEMNGSVSECYLPTPPLCRASTGKSSRQSFAEAFHNDTASGVHVTYMGVTQELPPKTSVYCKV